MDEWGWNLAFTSSDLRLLTPAEVDERIADRISGGEAVLKFLDGQSYSGIFALSKVKRNHRAKPPREPPRVATARNHTARNHTA